MKTLIAFHNDATIKDKLLASLTAHAVADHFMHGRYWEKGKGCAVGCTLESLGVAANRRGDHWLYESQLGIPYAVARLEDRIWRR